MQALVLLLLLQAPGDGWTLAQVPQREVKTLYWDLFDTTETWVSLIPSDPEGGEPLVRLVFQAFFSGKKPEGAPTHFVVRALPLPMTVVGQCSLSLVVDGVTVDLGSACVSPGAPGPPCQLLYPYGEESVANGVAVDLQSGLLERLVRAEEVTGTALGFPIMLSSGDTAALAELAGTVHEGKAPPE